MAEQNGQSGTDQGSVPEDRPQSSEQGAGQDPNRGTETEESGAGYGNHGDGGQGDAADGSASDADRR